MSFPRYPKYKDSGVEWFETIPESWLVQAFRHCLCEVFNGLTSPQVDETKETVPVTRIETISKGRIDEAKLGFIELKDAREDRKLRNGDVLFSNINSLNMIGNCAIYTGGREIYAGMNLLVLRPAVKGEPKWLYWLIRSTVFREVVESLAKPAINQASISQASLNSIAVPVPPTAEQTQIATFLDQETAKIDALISEQKRLIDLLKEKRQAIISHAVTKGLNPDVPMKDSGVEWLGEVPEHWKIGKLNKLISTRKGIAFKAHYFTDEGVIVVKASDIKCLTVRQPETYLPLNFLDQYPQAKLKIGEIILSTVGSAPEVRNSAVGQLGKVPGELAGSLLNQNTVVYVPSEASLTNNFLFLILQTTGYRDHLDLYAHGTANQASLNVSDMLEFAIPLPAPGEQDLIANFLSEETSKIDTLIDEAQHAINLLQERRIALISAAVTGQIDVRSFTKKELS